MNDQGPRCEHSLGYAFAVESKAAARALAFAQKAEQEGRTHLARLFRAVAESESVHARRYLLLMRGKIGTTADNQEAFCREVQEHARVYPRLIEQARAGGARAAAGALEQALAVRERNLELHRQAGERGTDQGALDYYVCQVCGYMHEHEPPERCPVCGAVPEKFKLAV